jgi:hypothetical protein
MKLSKGLNPVTRAVGVFSAVAIITGGVTYAALTSSATLTDNTITSANASLLLWDGETFASTAPGFDFTGLIPGEGSDEKKFYVKNAGDSALDVTAHVPVAPEAPAEGYGFTGWENLKVNFKSFAPDCPIGDNTVETTMAALMAGEVALPCNTLDKDAQGNGNVGSENTEGNYSVTVDIEPSAVTPGATPSVGDFDLVFTGTAAADNDSLPVTP